MAQLEEQELILIFFIGSLGMMVMLMAIGFFIVSYNRKLLQMHRSKTQMEQEHSQKMIKAQLESQERERVRIAAELHDSLGSLLFSVKLNSSYIQRISNPNSDTDHIFNEMDNILDVSIETVRKISWELTPQAFNEAGLSNSLRRLCGRVNGKGKLIEFFNNGDVVWNDEKALNIYRIIQELLNNAIKHAEADKISVRLNWAIDTLEVCVEDNGTGFQLHEVREGVGWWNVTQRANQLNAKIYIGKPPIGKGSKITLTIPL